MRTFSLFCAAASVLGMLVGCAAAPRGNETPSEAERRYQDKLATEKTVETPHVPDVVTLKDSIDATLAHHRGLKVVQASLEASRHDLRQAKAGWGPSVDVVGKVGANHLDNNTTRQQGSDSGMYGAHSISLTLTQPLWDGFATRSRVRAGEATVDAARFNVLDSATTFGLDAVTAHVDLIRRHKLVELARQNVEQHREILASLQERVRLGATSQADVSQTQGRLARALSSLEDAEASLREGEAAYTRLTGMPAPAHLEAVSMPPKEYGNLEDMLEVASRENPKINAYLAQVRTMRANHELTKAAYQPSLDLETGPAYSDREGPGSQWVSSFDIMGVMRWNVFSSGADVAADKAAAARVRQASQTVFNYADDLSLQMNDTWTRYLAAKEQQKYYEEAMGYNRQTLDAYLEQFNLGERSLLDVLDAENELFSSSTQYETATGNVIVGAYTLRALMGVLLPELGVDTRAFTDAEPDMEKQTGTKAAGV